MPIDMDDAMRGGHVSARAAKKHGVGVKGPKAKPSEMKPGKRDEGRLGHKGFLHKGHINEHAHQKGGRWMPTKGGAVNASYTPGVKTIDEFPQGKGKKFPAGGKIEAGGGRVNPGSKARIPPSGGYYGGGGQNTQ